MVTTTLLTSRRAAIHDWLRQLDPWLVAALAVAIVAGLAGLWQARPAAAPVAPAATLAPVLVMVTQQPTADTIAVAVAEMRLPRAVVAYDQPDGRVLGAIDSGRSYEIVARSGLDWLQIAVDGSGLIWIQRAELEGQVPDLATPEPPPPTVAPIVVYVAPPAAVATAAPQPTAAPAPAVRVGGCSAIEAAAKCSRTLPRR